MLNQAFHGSPLINHLNHKLLSLKFVTSAPGISSRVLCFVFGGLWDWGCLNHGLDRADALRTWRWWRNWCSGVQTPRNCWQNGRKWYVWSGEPSTMRAKLGGWWCWCWCWCSCSEDDRSAVCSYWQISSPEIDHFVPLLAGVCLKIGTSTISSLISDDSCIFVSHHNIIYHFPPDSGPFSAWTPLGQFWSRRIGRRHWIHWSAEDRQGMYKVMAETRLSLPFGLEERARKAWCSWKGLQSEPSFVGSKQTRKIVDETVRIKHPSRWFLVATISLLQHLTLGNTG